MLLVLYVRGFPQSSADKKNSTCSAGDPSFIPRLGISPGEGIGYPLQYSWASLVTQMVKKSAYNVGDLGSISGLGRGKISRRRHGNLLHYSCLENPHGRKRLIDYSPWGRKELEMTE